MERELGVTQVDSGELLPTRGSRYLVKMGRDQQYRDRCATHDTIGHTADEPAADSRSSFGAQHDQIRFILTGVLRNDRGRATFENLGGHFNALL